MTSAQLEIFLSLSESLNFSRTANELFMSQSYVSKQIAKLEEEWKIKLFERNHHNVDLTPAGAIMLEYAKISKHQLDDALYRAHSLSEQIGMQLHFGVLSQINTRTVTDMIRLFRDAHPSVHVILEYAEEEQLMTGLWNGNYDLILTSRDAVTHRDVVHYRALWSGNYHIAISLESNPPTQLSRNLDWLDSKYLITVSNAARISMRSLLNQLRIQYGFIPKLLMDAPNRESCFRMVESGMGFTFVDEIPAGHPPKPLVTFLDTGIAYSIGIAYRTDTSSDIAKVFASLPWTQCKDTL